MFTIASPELFLGDRDADLVARAKRTGARVVELAAAAFRSLSSSVRPDGIAAIVERPARALETLRTGAAPLSSSRTRSSGPGTSARSCERRRARAHRPCSSATADPHHPESVRGSVGTIFHLDVAKAASGDALAWCARRSVRVVVATPD